MNANFWQNKKVLITGHTGFKGSWLSLWLQQLGAHAMGYALEPNTSPNLFTLAKVSKHMQSIFGDIRDFAKVQQTVRQFQPDIIIHMAAQPLVRYSYQNPIETYETNVIGTVNLLEAARHCEATRVIVNITTDKCYENCERDAGYRENEPLGGYDPYSSSKACSEIVSAAYRTSFMNECGKALATARAGNVIGGGDWCADRLIPDFVRAATAKQPMYVRYPNAIRPWQFVLEPLRGYLLLAEKLWNEPSTFSGAWNFGPYENESKPVSWIMDYMVNHWNGTSWKTDNERHPHEAHYLKLNIEKAETQLDWHPKWNLENTLNAVTQWYQAWENNNDMQTITLNQINAYSTQQQETILETMYE